jgi:DNA-binding HxlR family transcriptional regulator
MDIIGERWALPVMRELMLGPRRFSELRRSLPALSANVLTQRLEGLEEAGIVERQKLPPPASVQVYALTPWGREAGPVFQALGRWAARSPAHDPTRPFSAVSLMLSLRTMFSAERAGAETVRAGFRFGEDTFHFVADAEGVTIGRGFPDDPEFILSGGTQGVAALVYGGAPVADIESQALLTIEGDRGALARFATLFPTPPKVSAG